MIFITVNIFGKTHCQTNKKIKRADQILPEVYDTTLRTENFNDRYILWTLLVSHATLTTRRMTNTENDSPPAEVTQPVDIYNRSSRCIICFAISKD